MIEITIRDTETNEKPMVLAGEFGFAVVKIGEDEEDAPKIGSMAMGEINLMNMPKDIAALGKSTRHMIENLDDSKVDGIIRVLSFEQGFKEKDDDFEEVDA